MESYNLATVATPSPKNIREVSMSSPSPFSARGGGEEKEASDDQQNVGGEDSVNHYITTLAKELTNHCLQYTTSSGDLSTGGLGPWGYLQYQLSFKYASAGTSTSQSQNEKRRQTLLSARDAAMAAFQQQEKKRRQLKRNKKKHRQAGAASSSTLSPSPTSKGNSSPQSQSPQSQSSEDDYDDTYDDDDDMDDEESDVEDSSLESLSWLTNEYLGATVLLTVICHQLGDVTQTLLYSKLVLKYLQRHSKKFPKDECDLWYGRAGALQAILFLRQELSKPTASASSTYPTRTWDDFGVAVAVELALEILKTGRRTAQRKFGPSSSPGPSSQGQQGLLLLWKWRGTAYLGAAHGMVGILTTLLSLSSLEWEYVHKGFAKGQGDGNDNDDGNAIYLVRQTLDALANHCHPSGNLLVSLEGSTRRPRRGMSAPSSSAAALPGNNSNNNSDRHIDWSNGAPGYIWLLLQAYQVYQDVEYLEHALELAETIVWPRRKLLVLSASSSSKGKTAAANTTNLVSLATGLSGIAYTLLRLAYVSNDPLWKHRAETLAKYLVNHWKDQFWTATTLISDRPYSLLEGMGGLISLLLDLSGGAGTAPHVLQFPLFTCSAVTSPSGVSIMEDTMRRLVTSDLEQWERQQEQQNRLEESKDDGQQPQKSSREDVAKGDDKDLAKLSVQTTPGGPGDDPDFGIQQLSPHQPNSARRNNRPPTPQEILQVELDAEKHLNSANPGATSTDSSFDDLRGSASDDEDEIFTNDGFAVSHPQESPVNAFLARQKSEDNVMEFVFKDEDDDDDVDHKGTAHPSQQSQKPQKALEQQQHAIIDEEKHSRRGKAGFRVGSSGSGSGGYPDSDDNDFEDDAGVFEEADSQAKPVPNYLRAQVSIVGAEAGDEPKKMQQHALIDEEEHSPVAPASGDVVEDDVDEFQVPEAQEMPVNVYLRAQDSQDDLYSKYPIGVGKTTKTGSDSHTGPGISGSQSPSGPIQGLKEVGKKRGKKSDWESSPGAESPTAGTQPGGTSSSTSPRDQEVSNRRRRNQTPSRDNRSGAAQPTPSRSSATPTSNTRPTSRSRPSTATKASASRTPSSTTPSRTRPSSTTPSRTRPSTTKTPTPSRTRASATSAPSRSRTSSTTTPSRTRPSTSTTPSRTRDRTPLAGRGRTPAGASVKEAAPAGNGTSPTGSKGADVSSVDAVKGHPHAPGSSTASPHPARNDPAAQQMTGLSGTTPAASDTPAGTRPGGSTPSAQRLFGTPTAGQQEKDEVSPRTAASQSFVMSPYSPPGSARGRRGRKSKGAIAADMYMRECMDNCRGEGSILSGGLGSACFLRMKESELCNPARRNRLLDEALEKAKAALKLAQQRGKFEVSLMTGDYVGAKCLLAMILNRLGDVDAAHKHAEELVQKLEELCSRLPTEDCTLMYGRAGALLAVWNLRQNLGDVTIGREFVLATCNTILMEGLKNGGTDASSSLLLWKWRGRSFLGAATGMVGILHALLGLEQDEWEELDTQLPRVKEVIRLAIDSLKNMCHASGNLRASMDGSDEDQTVDWSQGATGHCLLLIKAAEVFEDDAYLELAKEIAENVVWSRRVQKKGVGLSRGVAGTAYMFLSLADADGDNRKKWVSHAELLANSILNDVNDLLTLSKRPNSLFEGVGGYVALLMDLENEVKGACFPLYETRLCEPSPVSDEDAPASGTPLEGATTQGGPADYPAKPSTDYSDNPSGVQGREDCPTTKNIDTSETGDVSGQKTGSGTGASGREEPWDALAEDLPSETADAGPAPKVASDENAQTQGQGRDAANAVGADDGNKKDKSTVAATRDAEGTDRDNSPIEKDEIDKTVRLARQQMDLCTRNTTGEGNLMGGGLGPCVFLRIKASQTIQKKFGGDTNQLLRAALDEAKSALKATQRRKGTVHVSIYIGEFVGCKCLLAAIYYKLGNKELANRHASQLLTVLGQECSDLEAGNCDVTYGRAGALQAIWYLRQELEDTTIGQELVSTQVKAILLEGLETSQKLGTNSFLMWTYKGKAFLGAAHGMVGILHSLLGQTSEDWRRLEAELPRASDVVKQAIEALEGMRYPSGNLRALLVGMDEDKYTEWAHGSPGYILLLIKAAEVFDKARYLDLAKDMAEKIVWPRRMTRKGAGLIKGAAGFGYVFLALARVDEKNKDMWRRRALNYAHEAVADSRSLLSQSTRPYSLFEGLGGLVSLLMDVAYMDTAHFPFFESEPKKSIDEAATVDDKPVADVDAKQQDKKTKPTSSAQPSASKAMSPTSGRNRQNRDQPADTSKQQEPHPGRGKSKPSLPAASEPVGDGHNENKTQPSKHEDQPAEGSRQEKPTTTTTPSKKQHQASTVDKAGKESRPSEGLPGKGNNPDQAQTIESAKEMVPATDKSDQTDKKGCGVTVPVATPKNRPSDTLPPDGPADDDNATPNQSDDRLKGGPKLHYGSPTKVSGPGEGAELLIAPPAIKQYLMGYSGPSELSPLRGSPLSQGKEGGNESYPTLLAEQFINACLKRNVSDGNLYSGGIGPLIFLQMKMTKHLTRIPGTGRIQCMAPLKSAAEAATQALKDAESSRGPFSPSILTGEWVGAKCLLAAALYNMDKVQEARAHAEEAILRIDHAFEQAPGLECDVMYGRAGALQAVWYLRQELEDPELGRDFALGTSLTIIIDGLRTAKKKNNGWVLLWEWRGKCFLGASNGIAGILHSVLGHSKEELNMLERRLPQFLETIKGTIDTLHNYRHPSGNLRSTLDGQEEEDRLFEWAHGTAGYCLLLIRASEVLEEPRYLDRAKELAEDVLWPRRLQRMSVGLSRGMAGIGYVFLGLARMDVQNRAKWKACADFYVEGAVSNWGDLLTLSNRPYSLYEGLGGLASLILDLENLESGHFPFFETKVRDTTNLKTPRAGSQPTPARLGVKFAELPESTRKTSEKSKPDDVGPTTAPTGTSFVSPLRSPSEGSSRSNPISPLTDPSGTPATQGSNASGSHSSQSSHRHRNRPDKVHPELRRHGRYTIADDVPLHERQTASSRAKLRHPTPERKSKSPRSQRKSKSPLARQLL